LCQRYYEKSFQLEQAPVQAVGNGNGCFALVQTVGQNTSQFCGSVDYKVTKRIGGSITFFNPINANAQFYNSITGGSTSSTVAQNVGQSAFIVTTTTQSGAGGAGNGLFIHWTADAEL
jgi:hypothetical protein